MTPERRRQVEELYHAARERTPDERASLLAETDSDLRRAVEERLANPSTFDLASPAPISPYDQTSTAPPDDRRPATVHHPGSLYPGVDIGSYHIEAPLGAGGMGEVYRARDRKLERDVAIKTLPSGVGNDAALLNRFRRLVLMVASVESRVAQADTDADRAE